VFLHKRNLKYKKSNDFKVFLSEDLTQKRQQMVKALEEARKANVIASHWTVDGRIFYKMKKQSSKILLTDINEIGELYTLHASEQRSSR
jgi:hypothetical protein